MARFRTNEGSSSSVSAPADEEDIPLGRLRAHSAGHAGVHVCARVCVSESPGSRERNENSRVPTHMCLNKPSANWSSHEIFCTFGYPILSRGCLHRRARYLPPLLRLFSLPGSPLTPPRPPELNSPSPPLSVSSCATWHASNPPPRESPSPSVTSAPHPPSTSLHTTTSKSSVPLAGCSERAERLESTPRVSPLRPGGRRDRIALYLSGAWASSTRRPTKARFKVCRSGTPWTSGGGRCRPRGG